MKLENKVDKRTIIIYVIELEKGNYYVGQTTNLKRRLEEHIKGRRGSGWKKLHKIVHLYRNN